MNTEALKLRYLPTPRLLAVVTLGICIITGAVLFFVAPKASDTYLNSSSVALSFAISLPMIVLGVWIVSVEFSSGTLQRTLTAEADRNRVLLAKLGVVVAVALVLSVAAAATAGGLADFASTRAGVSIDRGELARALFGAVPTGVADVMVGFAFALLTRSMGGGISLSVAFIFILDGVLVFIPGLKYWTFGNLSSDLTAGLSDIGHAHFGIGIALAGLLAWLAVLLVPGWLLFTRGDLK